MNDISTILYKNSDFQLFYIYISAEIDIKNILSVTWIEVI